MNKENVNQNLAWERVELASLRDRAQQAASSLPKSWKRAYQALVDALDYVDAVTARDFAASDVVVEKQDVEKVPGPSTSAPRKRIRSEMTLKERVASVMDSDGMTAAEIEAKLLASGYIHPRADAKLRALIATTLSSKVNEGTFIKVDRGVYKLRSASSEAAPPVTEILPVAPEDPIPNPFEGITGAAN